jgi:aconitate decarboxylase
MEAVSNTRTLARFAARLRYDEIPARTVDHAKLCILDAVGCGLFGSTLEWTQLAVDTMRDIGGSGVARIWGTDAYASPDAAALVNGTAVHSFELDDLHKTAIMHPGGVTLPAVVAVSEMNGATGPQLLTALVAGYEVGIRVGLAVGLGLLHRGWHNNGVLGAFASTAAVGNLLGLDEVQMEHALGMAASQAGGLMAAQYGAMVKRLHAGKAAQSGVYAAALAARGFTGIEDVFAERYGNFFGTFADHYDDTLLIEGLGERWEIENVGFKWYPACGSSHTSIDAVLSLQRDYGIEAGDVERCVIACSTATKDHVGWPYEPDSVTTAQMNLSYAVAIALVYGEVAVEHFRPELVAEPSLVDLAQRVETEADPQIDARGPRFRHAVRLRLECRDGRVVDASVDHAKGSEAFPLSETEVRQKFTRLAGAVLPDARVDSLEEAIDDFEAMRSGSDFTQLLVPDALNEQ